jgi:hypothetical protein
MHEPSEAQVTYASVRKESLQGGGDRQVITDLVVGSGCYEIVQLAPGREPLPLQKPVAAANATATALCNDLRPVSDQTRCSCAKDRLRNVLNVLFFPFPLFAAHCAVSTSPHCIQARMALGRCWGYSDENRRCVARVVRSQT